MTLDLHELLTISEAARRTPFSEGALRAKSSRGELDPVRIGGHIFLTEEELRGKLGELYEPGPRNTSPR